MAIMTKKNAQPSQPLSEFYMNAIVMVLLCTVGYLQYNNIQSSVLEKWDWSNSYLSTVYESCVEFYAQSFVTEVQDPEEMARLAQMKAAKREKARKIFDSISSNDDDSKDIDEDMINFDRKSFLDTYRCNPNHTYRATILRHDPFIMNIEDFFMPGESEFLRWSVINRLRRSSTFSSIVEARTSYTAFLGKAENEVVECIEKRAHGIVNIPGAMMENLQVVRYRHGQKYEPHFDFFDQNTLMSEGRQRIVTIFGYLNTIDPSQGGGTYFPELNLTVNAVKNSAAMWYDVDVNDREDVRTLHGGVAVKNAVKWGLNIWIEEPEPRMHVKI